MWAPLEGASTAKLVVRLFCIYRGERRPPLTFLSFCRRPLKKEVKLSTPLNVPTFTPLAANDQCARVWATVDERRDLHVEDLAEEHHFT
jgi:hypothetical protein